MKPVYVYAIPQNGDPFLMFIADRDEESAHRNAHKTRHFYAQKLVAYEFRNENGSRHFDFEVAA